MSTAIHIVDHNNDSRKILWAVLASLFLHLVVAFLLAAFGGKLTSSSLPEDRPSELTLMTIAPTPAPATKTNARFLETDDSKKSAETPKEKTFESNANSIAAGQVPARGDSDLPSQNGKDRPFPNLENQAPSIGLEPKPMRPTPAPSAIPTPQATAPLTTPTPAPTTKPSPDQLAMLTATPPPALTPSEELAASPTPETAIATPAPQATPPPESSYRAYKEQTHISGRITNRGPSSVNAVGTPLGRYQKLIYDAIGSRWLYYTKKQMDLVSIGTARVTFSVDRDGHVANLRLVSNSSNESFANVCLESIQQAKAPPIPEDVVDILPPEGLTFEIGFTLFPNQ